MMEFISWEYDIPNWMKNKICVPNHQDINGIIVEYQWDIDEYTLRESNMAI